MNLGIIFAGGTGKRMNTTSRPKQFLLLNGKPIIIYTIEVFENSPKIDGIIVVCIEEWIPYLQKAIKKYDITKVIDIVPGGKTGPQSIMKGLERAEVYAKAHGQEDDTIVLIHDGVRPLIYEKTINDNIDTVHKYGSCVTTTPAIETMIIKNGNDTFDIPDRNEIKIARAPQSFYLKDVIRNYRRQQEEEIPEFIDTCSLMSHYGCHINTVTGPVENIKITTPTDFFLFRAMIDAMENQQIFGIMG